MAQQEAAKALANILNKVTRYSVLLGIGGSALQASLYTGKKAKKRKLSSCCCFDHSLSFDTVIFYLDGRMKHRERVGCLSCISIVSF